MRSMMRAMACCLALMLLMMSTASADGAFLMHSGGWLLEETPLDVVLKADVDTHMPFDADRLAMLTPVTDMLSMHLITGEDEGLLAISAEEETLLTLQYRQDAVQLSSMPGTTYVASDDPISVLLGTELSSGGLFEALGLAREGESLLADARMLMSKFPAAFEAYGKKAKNTTSISGYGRAAYTMDYTFQPKQLALFAEQLVELIPEGWLREIVSGLTFSGKQRIRMHFSAEDVLLRMEYNGACGPEYDLRTVKLIYKLRHDAEMDKDYVELTSPAKKGKNKNTLTFERTLQTNKKGARILSGEYEYIVSKDGVTSSRTGEFNLTNAYGDTADVLSGEMSFRSKLNGAEKYDEIILAPNLLVSGTPEQPVITGTLCVTEKYANRTTEQAVVSIDLKRADALTWNENSETIDLRTLDDVSLVKIRQEVASSVTTALVRPLILKLGKDAQWFFRDMPEETVQAIIDAASDAEKQP